MTDTHRDTILHLLVEVGEGCATLMDEQMQNLRCRHIQMDEIWSYVEKKQRWVTEEDDPKRVGDQWTFVALDADSKLIPTYRVGKRDLRTASAFLDDLARRLVNRVQLSSDALSAYVEATEQAFGADVDYGQIVKFYEAEPIGPGRYGPPRVTSAQRSAIMGKPDTGGEFITPHAFIEVSRIKSGVPSGIRQFATSLKPDFTHISTSYIERQNFTMRMTMRRFTRLTNAFSKKVENLRAAVALHFAHYNFVRIHSSLRVTPAMAAGVTDHLWTMEDLAALIDVQHTPKPRGPYKKRISN